MNHHIGPRNKSPKEIFDESSLGRVFSVVVKMRSQRFSSKPSFGIPREEGFCFFSSNFGSCFCNRF